LISLPNLAVRQAIRDEKGNTPHFLFVVLLWLKVTGSEAKACFTFSDDYFGYGQRFFFSLMSQPEGLTLKQIIYLERARIINVK